jgi:hypothetical protein
MALVIGAALSLVALFLWLSGHWFGWVLAFLPVAWLFQMSTGDYTDPWFFIAGRLIASAFVTGVPYLLWGRPRPYY